MTRRPPGPRLPLAKRLLFTLVIFGLLVVLVELASFAAYAVMHGEVFSYARVAELQREVGPESAGPGAVDTFSDTLALHPYLGFVYDPRSGWPATRDGPVVPGLGHGFLNPRGPIQKRAPDKVIVGVFGGSVARQIVVHAGEAFRAELAQNPALRGRRIEILSVAASAYKQPQQLLALDYLLSLGAEFDVVVNLDGVNDVSIPMSNVANGVNPAYPWHWNILGTRVPDPVVRRRQGRIDHLESVRRGLADWFASIPVPSVTLGLLWRSGDDALARRLGDEKDKLQSYRPTEAPFSLTGPRTDFESEEELLDDVVDLWRRSSLQMDRACKARGIPYLHFLQPNQYVTGSKPLSAAERKSAILESLPMVYPVRAGYPKMTASGRELRSRGVSFHDLTMLFENVEDTLYVDTCCHLNQQGNEMIARAIACAIAEEVTFQSGENGTPREPLMALTSKMRQPVMTRPFATFPLQVLGVTKDGSEIPMDPDDIEFGSQHPDVVRVLRGGLAQAMRPGVATVVARFEEHHLEFDVRVQYAPSVAFGRGSPGAGGVAPKLVARIGADGSVAFTVEHAADNVPGVLIASEDVTNTLHCGARIYVPRERAFSATPFNTTRSPVSDEGRFETELSLPAPARGRTTYWQAILTDPEGRCGWVATNGVAITDRR